MTDAQLQKAINLFFKDAQSHDYHGEDGSLKTIRAFVPSQGSNKELVKIIFPSFDVIQMKSLGRGVHKMVYEAKLFGNNEIIAIKHLSLSAGVLLNDKGSITVCVIERELQILRRLNHCNVVKLKYFFREARHISFNGYTLQYDLFFILEYVPDSLQRVVERYRANGEPMPLILIKVYMYQLFRALAYIHSLNISHRFIRESRILVNPESSVLKLCGFGNAKYLTDMHWVTPDNFIPYAPETLLGNQRYTTQIDLWRAGYVLAKLLLGRPIFSGSPVPATMQKIAQVLGPFTFEQEQHMLQSWDIEKHNNPATKPEGESDPSLISALQMTALYKTDDGFDLVSRLLKYSPHLRIIPLQACIHPFFNELRDPRTQLPDGRILPPLFNFTDYELNIQPELKDQLLAHYPTN